MSMASEFKEFIMRGNVVDLAVGVIIGGAFGKIVSSLVDQVIMPPIGLLTSGVDFAQLKLVLKAADPVAKKPEVAIQYGAFINTCIQFLIVAFVIFLIVQAVNRLRRQAAAAPPSEPPAPTPTELLLTEIRDALVARRA
jgi:large conductance mechanosensitive channel